MQEKTLQVTLTGEYFQPVRLHYTVFDRPALLQVFENLRCLEFVQEQERWAWLYEHEARRVKFKHSYDQLPEKFRPIIVGSVLLRGPNRMLIDLRSWERAVAAVEFFDQHISRSVAEVTEAEVVNKVFNLDKPELTPTSIFDQRSPGIERLPIHYYEDGLVGFELALKVRQIVALQHFLGNSKYSMRDAIRELVKQG